MLSGAVEGRSAAVREPARGGRSDWSSYAESRAVMFLVEVPEATWSEWCCLYRPYLKHVTVSEVDGEEQPVCYACFAEPALLGFDNPDIDFEPLNFQVQYYFQSRKGMSPAPLW